MRFSDFFIDYKIRLKDIKSLIPFTQLPLYRKIAIVVLFIIAVTGLIAITTNHPCIAMLVFGILLLLSVVFILVDSKKTNLKIMLSEHYAPYSEARMEMMKELLNKYNIEINDTKTIDLLFEEAKKAQIQSNYLLPIIKPIKTLSTIIIPIIVYVAKKMGDLATIEEMLPVVLQIIVIIICAFSIIMAIISILKEFTFLDYNKYNELMDDLSQIKLFYSKTNK